RTLAVPGGTEAGDQAGAVQRVGGDALVDADLRPAERFVEARFGRRDADGAAIEARIVIRGLRVEIRDRREDAIVGGLGRGAPFDAAGDHDRDHAPGGTRWLF